MNSLYLENSIIGSLFRFFSPYFSTAIQPTQFLLTWLVITQLALKAFPSLRFYHRNFLSLLLRSNLLLVFKLNFIRLVNT